MSSRELLLKVLLKNVLKTPAIIEAFRSIDRADFVGEDNLTRAYADTALPIGFNQTISQPSTVALMLEWLEPKAGQKILDVGSGSGWTTALLASIVGPKGKVIGVERIGELVELGKRNLQKYSFPWAEIVRAQSQLGVPEEAPFDRILVSAASRQLPQALLQQLGISGIIVVPVGDSIYKISRRSQHEFKQETHYGFAFVPLIEN